MSAPTFWHVLRFDGSSLRRSAATWDGLAARMDAAVDDLVPALLAAEDAWRGGAADLALARGRRVRHELAAGVVPVRAHEEILRTCAESGERLRAHAEQLRASAAAAGVTIDLDGRVSLAAGRPHEHLAPAVDWFQRQVDEVVAEAARLDREALCRLAEHAPRSEGPIRRFVPHASVPRPGSDPTAVTRWWDGLGAPRRRYVLTAYPELIGALAGVPTDARDRANRMVLGSERDRLAARLVDLDRKAARIDRTSGRLEPWRNTRLDELAIARERGEIEASLAGLDRVDERLGEVPPDGRRAYLLKFDARGDGRVVVAFGNPDRADNVLTYVPGTGAGLANVGGGLSRTDQMARDTQRLGGDRDTAVVYWLGYDAPDELLDASSLGPAEDAAADLRHYSEGLQATGDDPRSTFLGHSYGSTVVGQTAVDGLRADDLVFVGSPGVVADTAAELDIDTEPARHVWSSTAANDIIKLADPELAVTTLSPIGGRAVDGLMDLPDRIHGPDPSNPDFGGQVFLSTPQGHSGYWEPENPARESIAQIALGEHRKVTR